MDNFTFKEHDFNLLHDIQIISITSIFIYLSSNTNFLSKKIVSGTRLVEFDICVATFLLCDYVYLFFKIPILSNREVFIVGYGYDRLDHNETIMIYARSFEEDK